MPTSLSGRAALVTGGTRGIGRGIVTALAHAGADVVACYRADGPHVDDLARTLKEIPGDHHLVRADIGDPGQLTALADECRLRYGRLDVVVNNAGVISHQPIDQLAVDEWRRVLDTNLTGAFLVVREVLPLLGAGASIVNVGSRVATVGIPLRAHYTAAKAGLIGLTRSLAKELGPRGIRVNLVAPGVIATEKELPAEVLARYEQLTALRRLGTPQEVAAVVCFLASEAAGYLTGATVDVDGGI
ncbi:MULTISPECIES: SDR family NAD(P)-dependent oxidoreductase [unclassified Solwaraspora]|uniref:SDR family NAD(P)-dependent oxidoreductase n=1 Tax=unclassified Solwaraspora TaxID=2627926 RepID=UPI00259AF7CC|nr:SDR family NAD(P)-dependent oxidoreductase [Solwaraspora sp. WMMA2056]WJK38232.1 SDR family NAD(P)-dependent oxidoreductase [Solwaraspora sp. WMMA2056]